MSIDPDFAEKNAAWLDHDRVAFFESVTSPPERFHILSLGTMGEELTVQMNPTEFDDEIGAEYGKLVTPGQSHERMHYRNTNNYTVSMDLKFRAYNQAEYAEINRARHLLFSWCYPLSHDPGGPPRLLATWPQIFAIECRLISCKCRNERFAKNGAVLAYTASVVFEENRERYISQDQVALTLVVRGEL